MNADRSKVFSRFQLRPDEGPELYQPHKSMVLIGLNVSYRWRYHDLCVFYQAIASRISDDKRTLDTFVSEHKAQAQADTADEWTAVQQSRLREQIYIRDIEIRNMEAYADQLFMVGLWALVEQQIAKTLVEAERVLLPGKASTTSHRWNTLSKRFESLGIDFTKLKSFDGTNEARVLNNKIKHSGLVDVELGAFGRFQHLVGTNIDQIDLALQHYADCTFEFVGHLQETTDGILA
ncbi:MAG TPA: hypothetical protein VII56_14070 [Rhizomicrobium sp.]